MSESSHAINLGNKSLPELQELLERQETIMQNKGLLQRLKDKGESVTRLHDKILKEIEHRKDLNAIKETLSNLTVDCIDSGEFLQDKHIKYVCSKEKPIEDRYLPHRTLVHKQSTSEESPTKKQKDVTSASEPQLIHQSAKLISLSESLNIENEQAHRVLEEKAKKALSSLATDFLNDEDGNKSEEDVIEQEITDP